MRPINRIIWHCSATPEGVDVSTEAIKAGHVRDNGWRDIGYHFVIELDGTVVEGRPLDVSGAHTQGHNLDSIGVCYIGGVDKSGKPKDTSTPAQREALYRLTEDLLKRFPRATVHGHNEYAKKACPAFDVGRDWAEYLAGKAPARQ